MKNYIHNPKNKTKTRVGRLDFDSQHKKTVYRSEAVFKTPKKSRMSDTTIRARKSHIALARHYSDCKKCISIYTVYIDIHSL